MLIYFQHPLYFLISLFVEKYLINLLNFRLVLILHLLLDHLLILFLYLLIYFLIFFV